MDITVQDGDIQILNGELVLTDTTLYIQQQLAHLLATKQKSLFHAPNFGFDINSIFNYIVPSSAKNVAQELNKLFAQQISDNFIYNQFTTVSTEAEDDSSVKVQITVSMPDKRVVNKIVRFNIQTDTLEGVIQ